MIITCFICAAISLICGIIILTGKGDKLISGYNTASKEEQETYNIKRLRLIVALVCLLATALCAAMPFMATATGIAILTIAFVVITLALLLVAQTWCKKK